jgi:hypothetical protein
MSIIGLSKAINVTAKFCEVEVSEVPFGTFAGTLNRLVVLQNGKYLAWDTVIRGRPKLTQLWRRNFTHDLTDCVN